MTSVDDTIPARFLRTVAERSNDVAIREKVGDAFRTLTFGDYADQATHLAAGLRALGVGPGDRVVMLIRNRPEFHVADMAVLLLGATPISIYNSSSPDQIRYLAGHARASVAIVEDAPYLERMLEVRHELAGARAHRRDRNGRADPASSRGTTSSRRRRSNSKLLRPPPRRTISPP